MAPLLVTTRPMTTSTAPILVVSGHHSAAVEVDMAIDQDTTVLMIPNLTHTTVALVVAD